MSNGYTLIELLIAVSLTIILSGFGIAGFNNFNRNQVVNSAGKKIAEELKYTQSLVINQQKPLNGCITLNGYNFSITNSSTGTYSITAVCTPACDGDDCIIKTETLGISLSGASSVYFNILTSGVTIIGENYLSITGNNLTKYVKICSGGEISFSETLPTCP
jgi:Tfp pilus assembly protein FimT